MPGFIGLELFEVFFTGSDLVHFLFGMFQQP